MPDDIEHLADLLMINARMCADPTWAQANPAIAAYAAAQLAERERQAIARVERRLAKQAQFGEG